MQNGTSKQAPPEKNVPSKINSRIQPKMPNGILTCQICTVCGSGMCQLATLITSVSVQSRFSSICVRRGVREAQLIYLLCLLNLLTGLFTSNGGPGGLAGAGARARAPAPSAIAAESILQSLLPVLAVLNPPQNTALFPLLLMAGQNLDSLLRAAGAESAWLYGTLGFAFYFYQGNSNSLSTVDVGASFTGVSSYSPAPVTAITFANTYGAVVAAVLLFLAGGGPGVGDGDGDGDGDDGRKRKWKGAADALWSAGAAFLLSRACELVITNLLLCCCCCCYCCCCCCCR